jgi:hypothetical protein
MQLFRKYTNFEKQKISRNSIGFININFCPNSLDYSSLNLQQNVVGIISMSMMEILFLPHFSQYTGITNGKIAIKTNTYIFVSFSL